MYCLCAMNCPAACSDETIWHCFSASDGCPALLPNQGQPCNNNLQCSYGTCASGTAISVLCVDGIWAFGLTVCPN